MVILNIQNISPEFTLEVHSRDAYLYRLSALNQETFDQFLDITQQHFEIARVGGRHLYRLLDITQAGYPTPYASAQLIALATQTPDDYAHTFAVLVGSGHAMQLVEILVRRFPKSQQQHVRVFAHEGVAWDWLAHRYYQFSG